MKINKNTEERTFASDGSWHKNQIHPFITRKKLTSLAVLGRMKKNFCLSNYR